MSACVCVSGLFPSCQYVLCRNTFHLTHQTKSADSTTQAATCFEQSYLQVCQSLLLVSVKFHVAFVYSFGTSVYTSFSNKEQALSCLVAFLLYEHHHLMEMQPGLALCHCHLLTQLLTSQMKQELSHVPHSVTPAGHSRRALSQSPRETVVLHLLLPGGVHDD